MGLEQRPMAVVGSCQTLRLVPDKNTARTGCGSSQTDCESYIQESRRCRGAEATSVRGNAIAKCAAISLRPRSLRGGWALTSALRCSSSLHVTLTSASAQSGINNNPEELAKPWAEPGGDTKEESQESLARAARANRKYRQPWKAAYPFSPKGLPTFFLLPNTVLCVRLSTKYYNSLQKLRKKKLTVWRENSKCWKQVRMWDW